MHNKFKIRIIPVLWIVFVATVLTYSIATYIGVDWSPTEYISVMTMNGKTLFPFVAGELILLLLLFAFMIRRGYLVSSFMTKCALILMLTGLFWVLLSYRSFSNLLYINSNPVLLVEIAIVMIAVQRDDISALLKRWCPYLACFFSVLAFAEAITFRIRFNVMRMANGSVIQYFAYALFLVATWNAISKKTKRENAIIFACCAALFFTSFIITSRGWILQTLLLIAACYLSTSSKKLREKVQRIILAAIAFTGAYYILVTKFADSYAYILSRMTEVTRTPQLRAFFSQVSISQLIVGGGMKASYWYRGRDELYIDNQFFFWMFRYGILSVIGYWLPYFRALVRRTRSKNEQVDYRLYVVIMMRILVMAGVGIYYGNFLDIGNIYCMLITSEILKQKQAS